MPFKTPIRRPRSLTDLAAGHIRKAIIEGQFALGQPISETVLSEMYDISKTPVKLALVQLRSEGLVEIKPHKGSYVFTATAEEVIQLVEWRVAMEEASLEAAYTRNKDKLLMSLGAMYEKMHLAREKRDISESYALDALFHRTIVECARNKYLMNSYLSNIHMMNALLFRLGSTPWEYADRFEEHNTILKALHADDLHCAKGTLSLHIAHQCASDRLASLPGLTYPRSQEGK